MSLADHESEPIDEWEGYCQTHNVYFYHGSGCYACSEDAADRRYDERKERR